MKAQPYLAAIPLFAFIAFAQDPAPQAAQPAQDTKATSTAPAPKQNDSPAAEMKTRNYSGILADASCVTAGSVNTPAAAATAKTEAGEADRAATAGQGQSCPVSASTTQFAIKLKEGQLVKLDDVGNLRAQEVLKNKKKWSDAAASGKTINVNANGVLTGDQLITMSIK